MAMGTLSPVLLYAGPATFPVPNRLDEILQVTQILNLAAGDFIECRTAQTSGAAININGSNQTFGQVYRLH